MALVEDFFVARKPLKGSPHTEAAYRADLAGVSAHIAACLGTEPGELVLGHLLRITENVGPRSLKM